tara:strand:- start:197054 stop:197425 length:372 start_codon:yes stop_codon:yes gene_type:complete
MQALHVISRRSLDDLEAEIVTLSQRINAFEYEFLTLVREFDLRQGWKAYHFNNCAEWLNMKCGLCPGTAREKLRVAACWKWCPETESTGSRAGSTHCGGLLEMVPGDRIELPTRGFSIPCSTD